VPRKTNRSEKVAKEQTTKEKQPWNQQFEDDRDDDGNFSRIERRKHSRGNTVLTVVLVVTLLLLCLAPIVWQAVSKRMANSAESTTRISVAAPSESKKSSSESEQSSVKSSSSSKKSPSSSSSRASSSSVSTSSSSSASSSSSSSSSSSASGSYTVKSGDNLYRIAVNHGMTLAEIQALNGMGSSTSVTPGQTLKVK
jgi:LysM repeat protein